MKFPLKDIELHLEDQLVEQGENLLEQNRLSQLVELEKNLWLARFIGDQSYEVEIQLKGKKVQEYTCDCAQFKKKQLCDHLSASLLALREKIKAKEEERKAKLAQKAASSQNNGSPRLTAHHILQSISHDDLKAFVKKYASSNRHFSLSLKASFARKLEHPDSKEKYDLILDNTLKPHLRSSKKLSRTVLRQISAIVETLFVQLEDALSLQDFTESFAIIQACFDRIYPVVRKVELNPNPAIQILKDNLDYFGQLAQQDLAPDFKKQLWEFGLAEMQKLNYLRYNFLSSWYKIMEQLVRSPSNIDQLLEITNAQLQSDFMYEALYSELLIIQMNLLEKKGDQATINSIIKENEDKPEVLIAAIKDALKKSDTKKANFLALKALDSATLLSHRNELEEIILQIAIKKKQKRTIKNYATKRFLASYDFKYYELLKETQSKTWDSTVSKLLEEIDRQTYSLAKRDAIANIYFHENQPEDLLNYIQTIRSIDLLQQHADFLIQYDKKRCYQVYETLLDQYLEFHLGRKTALKIRSVFFHLEKIGATELKGRLLRKYRKLYKDRHSLIEELADF